MAKRPVLGRSINHLLGGEDDVLAGITNRQGALIQVRVDQLAPNPYQPRVDMDEDALAELTESIGRSGVLQPVLVRNAPNKAGNFELIAGHRRTEAARRAGLETIPAVIHEADDDMLLEIALVENLQRENLNAVDEALAYQSLIERFGYRHEDVAERVGKSRAYVTNILRLLSLPDFVRQALREDKLQVGHARALLPLEDKPRMQRAMEQVVDQGLSVRATEELVRRALDAPDAPRPERKTRSTNIDPNIAALQTEMQRRLGTRVTIQQSKPGRGQIRIDYYSLDDIDRICDIIGLKRD